MTHEELLVKVQDLDPYQWLAMLQVIATIDQEGERLVEIAYLHVKGLDVSMLNFMNGMLMLTIGVMTLIGLGALGFGIYCALLTEPKNVTKWDGHTWIWIGRVAIVLGLVMIAILLGHFVVMITT